MAPEIGPKNFGSLEKRAPDPRLCNGYFTGTLTNPCITGPLWVPLPGTSPISMHHSNTRREAGRAARGFKLHNILPATRGQQDGPGAARPIHFDPSSSSYNLLFPDNGLLETMHTVLSYLRKVIPWLRGRQNQCWTDCLVFQRNESKINF